MAKELEMTVADMMAVERMARRHAHWLVYGECGQSVVTVGREMVAKDQARSVLVVMMRMTG